MFLLASLWRVCSGKLLEHECLAKHSQGDNYGKAAWEYRLLTACGFCFCPIYLSYESFRPPGMTYLSHQSVCLSVCLRVGHRRRAEWGAAISGVCSAFINTSLLGDKLMSPGSLIATSQLLWVTSDTFFVLHHSGRSTSHAASYIRYKQWSISDWRGIFQRTERTSRRRRSCSHSNRMFFNSQNICDDDIITVLFRAVVWPLCDTHGGLEMSWRAWRRERGEIKLILRESSDTLTNWT